MLKEAARLHLSLMITCRSLPQSPFLKIRHLYFLNVRTIYDSLVMLISDMAPECAPGPELFLTKVARDGDAFNVIGLNVVLN